jgi:hypothetical protein
MCCIRPGRIVWLACLWWCGCAHTATVTYWRPAELNAPGLHRLAVAPFAGAHGDEIAGLLESRLWEEDAYSVADRSELGPAILTAGFPHDEIEGSGQLMTAAQRAGIDGIIEGEVLVYGVFTSNSHGAEPRRARLEDQQTTVTRLPRIGIPDQESPAGAARVELSLRLIDTLTGEVCASRHIRRESETGVRAGSPLSDDEFLDELTRDCLEEFMGVLVPQSATAEIRLASGEWYRSGSRDIRHGIRLARQGRWGEAEVLWQQVLERDPGNHATLYNLAVAAGQRQDFAAAEDYAMQALRAHHTDCYAKGLDQLRQFRADSDRIARQRQAQVIQASLAAWQD